MSMDRWLLISGDVLLSVWIIVRIIMLPAMLRNPGNGRMLTTYMQYRAEQRGKLAAVDKHHIFHFGQGTINKPPHDASSHGSGDAG